VEGEAEIEEHVVADDQLLRVGDLPDDLGEADGRVQFFRFAAVAFRLATIVLLRIQLGPVL
jgi:hypothetical protein